MNYIPLQKWFLKLQNFMVTNTRLVTNDSSVNVKMFKCFASGELTHGIPHPCDSEWRLYCWLLPHNKVCAQQFLCKRISNTRSCFRLLLYIQQLYEQFCLELLRPIRYLTQKHIYPNNFEKMNVLRAVQIFAT